MRVKKFITSLFLSFMFIICSILAVVASTVSINKADATDDAMTAIETDLSSYKIGETLKFDHDGYIGIPTEITTFFDDNTYNVVSGYNGTAIILYVINTQVERIGTASDVSIIRSMLERGYAVTVVDYLNSEKAVSPNLDYSLRTLHKKVEDKTILPSIFPSGKYYNNFIVPAGYNISLDHVFWEADKHGTDGTLEKIVENWNNDFRGAKADSLVKWVHADGTRKTVQNAKDGSSPTWYDQYGNTSSSGQYTKVKYTVAETITDCVNPDGSPLELNLYMDIIYPTNPAKDVPVMSNASAMGYLPYNTQTEGRSPLDGFNLRGYATAIYDYFWVPMARDDSFGYYDGRVSMGAVSGDHMNYSVHLYNDKKINTAAMRYLRYLSLSNHETYSFDNDNYGVLGYSKGGWFSFLGEEVVQSATVENPETYANTAELEKAIDAKITSFTEKRLYPNHHGETRYQNGLTESYIKDGVTIDGGELQPWLTYNGNEIVSGAQLIYASNGSQEEDITDGHAPTIIGIHFADDYNAPYYWANHVANLCRTHDVETLFLEVPLGHTFLYGEDLNYGIDTYAAVMDFANYYLKNDAVKVLYTDPSAGGAGISSSAPITVKFTGSVSQSEIEKVTVSDDNENALDGVWKAAYGKTEWTFYPSEVMTGSSTYTITVPAELKGENGVEMGTAYTASFVTEYDDAISASVTTGSGTYYYFTVPQLSDTANSYALRFRVTNEAANTAVLYSVTDFDPNAPDTATIGEELEAIALKGMGYYEIDVTPYVAEKVGSQVAFLIQAGKEIGETTVYSATFDERLGGATKVDYSTLSLDSIDGNGVMKIVLYDNEGAYTNDTFYENLTNAFKISNVLGKKIDESDYGRKFEISLKVYDTVSRVVQVQLTACTSEIYGTMDYDRNVYNFVTTAGEWSTFTFEYVVYDTDYGVIGFHTKDLIVAVSPDGDKQTPIYFDDISVTEMVTEIAVDTVALTLKDNGGISYKAPVSERVFALYTESGEKIADYASWNEVLSAYQDGKTVMLQNNYTLTDADLWNAFTNYNSIVIDLNGYSISSLNTVNSIFWLKNTVAIGNSLIKNTKITVKNGGILLKDTPLISYGDSASSGAGKVFDFDFQDVTIGIIDNATLTEIISASKINAGETAVNIAFTNTTFHFDDEKLNSPQAVLFPAGQGVLTIKYAITGGCLELDSQRWITAQNSFKHSIFYPNQNGDYMTLTLPDCEKPNSTAYMREDGYATYEGGEGTKLNGFTTYTLYKSELSTMYGMIPKEYADVLIYPFVVFDADGNFLTAKNMFASDNNGGAVDYAAVSAEGEWIILLRRDFVYQEAKFNNLSFVHGAITIDLGSNTFTCAQTAGPLFIAYAKDVKTTNVTVKNGTFLISTKQPLVNFDAMRSSSSYNSVKTFNFTFEDITFTTEAGTTLPSSLFAHNTVSTLGVNGNVTFIDCVMDFSNVSGNMTVFDLGNTAGDIASDVVIRGGEIIASNFELIALFKINNVNSNSIVFERNNDGEYIKALVSTEVVAPTYVLPTDEGDMYFEVSDSKIGEYTVYELRRDTISTAYGEIPIVYEDTHTYPFAVFNAGKFVGVYSTWKDALDSVKLQAYGKNATDIAVQVLLRRDYTTTSADAYNDLSNIGGTLLLDLNGYIMTRDVTYIFDAFAKPTLEGDETYSIHNTTVKVISGTLATKNYAIGDFNHINNDSNYVIAKTFDFTFSDVVFMLAEGASSDSLIFEAWSDGSIGCNATLTLKNCTFDLKTVTPTKSVTLLNFNDSKKLTDVVTTIKGGEILAESLNYITIYNIDSEDSIIFKEYMGEYVTLMCSASALVPTQSFSTDSGDMIFVEMEADGTNTVYVLRSLDTVYGTIPNEYASVADYPFAVFKNKIFQGAYATWYAALDKVKGQSYGAYDTSVVEVVLRRDYETTSGDGYAGNFSQIASFILDLNGFTMTSGDAYIFDGFAKYTEEQGSRLGEITIHATTVKVKNGTFLAKNRSIGCFNHINDGNYATPKTFDFTFDNVTFGLAENATESNIVLVTWWDGNVGCNANVVFNDCIFDLKTISPTHAITLLNFNDNKNTTTVTATINGGTILANSFNNIAFYSLNEGTDTVGFGRGTDDEYITLTLSTGGVAPVQTFTTDDGDKCFAKISTSGTNDIYELRNNIETPYGTISGTYESVTEYPFAVFKNGILLGAYGNWKDALNKVKAQSYGAYDASIVQVLLRRDYVTLSTDKYDNFSQIASFVLDLNGYTMTSEGAYIFDGFAKITPEQGTRLGENTIHTTMIKIKNGTLLAKSCPIGNINHINNNLYTSRKTFDFTFDNVTFGLAENATESNIVLVTWCDGPIGCNATVVFNNCTFDFKTVVPSKPITVMNFDDTKNLSTINVHINGGKILVDSNEGITLYKFCGDDDSIIFGQYEEEYIKLDFSSDILAPFGEIPTLEGDMYFQKDTESGIYLLQKCKHSYTNVCDTTCDICLESRTVGHVYSNACDGICNTEGCNGERTPAAHTGGTSTCTTQAKCQECGQPYGELDTNNHSHSAEWSKDDTKHWHECACGDKADEAEHIYGEWIVVKEMTTEEDGLRKKTCECGHEVMETIPKLKETKIGCAGCNGSAQNLGIISIMAIITLTLFLKKRKEDY